MKPVVTVRRPFPVSATKRFQASKTAGNVAVGAPGWGMEIMFPLRS